MLKQDGGGDVERATNAHDTFSQEREPQSHDIGGRQLSR